MSRVFAVFAVITSVSLCFLESPSEGAGHPVSTLTLAAFVAPAMPLTVTPDTRAIPFSAADPGGDQVFNFSTIWSRANGGVGYTVYISSQSEGQLGADIPYNVSLDARPLVLSNEMQFLFGVEPNTKPSALSQTLRVTIPARSRDRAIASAKDHPRQSFKDTLTLSIVAF